MEITVLGMIVLMQPAINALVRVLMMALQLSRESYTGFSASTTICSKLLQLENTLLAMEFTVFGMFIEVRDRQLANAYSPMVNRELEKPTEVRP